MPLPIYLSQLSELTLMQTKWAIQLDTLVENPSLKSIILPNVALSVGSNTVNHTLGRKLQGWRIVRINAPATIYDEQDTNQMTHLTLILNSDMAVSVNLEVF